MPWPQGRLTDDRDDPPDGPGGKRKGPPPEVKALKAEIERLRTWVDDLQSGMFINCVYCGHRYGPKDKVPDSMAEVLKRHVEQCPKHPMSALKTENERLRGALRFYADISGILWEDAGDPGLGGLFRFAITGTSHPSRRAREALGLPTV